MYTRKPAQEEPNNRPEAEEIPAEHNKVPSGSRLHQIQVTSLQIDNDYDHEQDCDPYNSTGQFVILEAKKRD